MCVCVCVCVCMMCVCVWEGSEYMWQSCVEIKGYFVAYFNRIAVFEAMYHRTSVKGGAHTCFVDA